MSDSRWLTSEVRWAREQQVKAERLAADLRDPRKLDGMRSAARNKVESLRWKFRAEMRDALVKRTDLDPDHVDDLIARHETDAARWRQLADEYTDRIVSTEGTDALFEETP